MKTFTGWAANKVWIKETRRLRVLSFYALLQSFALEQCFRLFYITFSWKFLEFRNWNAPKNAKTAIRTDSKLCVSIQGSYDLQQKWPMFVWVSVGVTLLWRHLWAALDLRLKLFLSLLGDGSSYSSYFFLLIDGLRNRAKVTLRASLARQPYCSYCIRDTLITYRGTHLLVLRNPLFP